MDKPTLSVGIAGYEHDSNSIWYQKSVYFLCEVKCIPRAVYIWKKNGVVIAGTDGTMHLKKIGLSVYDVRGSFGFKTPKAREVENSFVETDGCLSSRVQKS